MIRPLAPYQLVVDLVVAGLFGLVMVLGEVTGTTWPSFDGGAGGHGAVAVALLLAGALGIRRLAPGLSLAVAWVAAIVQMLCLLSPRPSDVAIFAVLYATAAYGSRLIFWLGFASSLVGSVVITLYVFLMQAVVSSLSWSTIPAALAVLVAATFALLLSWTTGALVRTAIRARENRVAQVRAEEDAAAEQERVRIARDMHDVVAHSLAVVIAQADGARYAAASASDSGSIATDALATIATTARSALADVRLLLTQLRHAQGDGPQPTLADLEELYAQVRATGVDLRVDVDPAPRAEPGAGAQLAVYRILQEALTNALRHGDGGRVEVRLAWRDDRVELEVRNATDASAPPVSGAGEGHGLIGMRERAQLAGGTLSAGRDDGAFVVSASVPVGGLP